MKGIAEIDELARLPRSLLVDSAGLTHRLIGENTDGIAVHSSKGSDQAPRVIALQFEIAATIHQQFDELVHVVGAAMVIGDERFDGRLPVLRIDRCGDRSHARRRLVTARREVGEKRPDRRHALRFRFRQEARLPGFLRG